MATKYVKFGTPSGSAFFQESPSGLQAVADPNVLRQLQSGSLTAEDRSIAQVAAPQPAAPTPATQSVSFAQTVAQPAPVAPAPTGSNYIKIGERFFTNQGGSLQEVSDSGPLSSLKAGAIPARGATQSELDLYNKQSQPDLSSIQGSAMATLEALGLTKVPTAAELAEKALSSDEFKLIQERLGLKTTASQAEVEAKKAQLESEFEADKATLENKLAANGLAFSGIRATQVKALIDNLAASKLDLDRKLASSLLDANLDLKESMLKAATEVIKDAQEGRKEALNALKDIGLTVIGNQVVPTLAAQRETRAQEADIRSQQRLDLAEQANERAEQRLEIFMKQQELGSSASERLRNELKPIFSDASTKFSENVGSDGFVDPKLYLQLRQTFINTYPDKANLFDDTFAPQFLSQQSRTDLGIKKSLSPLDLLLSDNPDILLQ